MRDNDWTQEEIFDCTDGLVIQSSGGSRSGLFVAIETAYNGHHKLHLRPDDIMLAIAQGVGAHLSYGENAEKYRQVFVDHEGKEQINVDAKFFLTGDSRFLYWPCCVQAVVNELTERVKGDTCQLLLNDFSTTDAVSRTASQVVLMDTMKHYFEYGFSFSCGIPEIELHGTLDDWHTLLARARALRALEIGLDWWLDVLEPVLEKLIETYSGNVDEDWWSHVFTREEFNGSGGGVFFDGWFQAFFPYTVKGKQARFGRLDAGDVPSGMVNCPFTIIENGRQTDSELVAGSFGARVTEDGGVAPYIGWLVKKKGEEEAPFYDMDEAYAAELGKLK
ncbi:hypothetical protein KFL_006050030 [Klebsormidium nitens]|uniref:Uncharacterized protein n=1 Tax=Klebsormidium nitens TaxID=105231 RepID=A0A1Y1IGZ7_KLENI|nr:hypothetical protein KFL_006050030 [Klebsormidium nitens]|eukprot:GAQ90140.1 hypothetical protein KFL_006050030 [Klebsormidium nitens]